MSSKSNSSSIHSFQVPQSVTSETKQQFEALFKKKSRHKTKESQENLVVEVEDFAYENPGFSQDDESKNYILDKFMEENAKKEVEKKVDKSNEYSEASDATYTLSLNETYNIEEAVIHTQRVEKEIEIPPKPKPRKLKKLLDENEGQAVKPKPRQRLKKEENESKFKYERIIEIIIHKTDRLLLNPLLVHPVVKIHIVDMSNGRYFGKSHKERSIVFFYENKNFDYISPVMTHAFNLQEKRTLFPAWEETILLNEDYEYFVEERKKIIIFFEVLDFVTFSSAQRDCADGWLNVGFAFLKLSGAQETLNLNKRLRLQLYKPHRQTKKQSNEICPIWHWWKKKKLSKYPSTLHITIKPVISPQQVVDALRSKTPIQPEKSSTNWNFDGSGEIIKNPKVGAEMMVNLARPDTKISKFPNKILSRFKNYDDGCFVGKFSHGGLYLACAVKCDDIFCLAIFSVEALKQITRWPCHQGLIYNIKWSLDDSLIISASADNTVSVYDFEKRDFMQILAHPSFVYCCEIINNTTIASGCFDKTIRIWRKPSNKSKAEFELCQEINKHKGYVTSICFNKNYMYTSDSVGEIIEWTHDNQNLKFEREIFVFDLQQIIINQIALFAKKKRILVHSRDGVIRTVDLKSGCVLQSMRNNLSKTVQTFCSLTPCGNYVYCGSDNGEIHVFNCRNGRLVATYNPFGVKTRLVVHWVEFHPINNILAVAQYGENFPILLYGFDGGLQEPEVDLKVFESASDCKIGLKLKKAQIFSIRSDDKGEKIDFRDILKKMDEVIVNNNSL